MLSVSPQIKPPVDSSPTAQNDEISVNHNKDFMPNLKLYALE